jgi:Protein of unknown function (DUF1553)
LTLLNDPFVLQQAEVWAQRLVARPDHDVASRIEAMFDAALGRPPSASERDRFRNAAGKLAELHQVALPNILNSVAVWKELAHAMFNLQEFIFIP